MRQVMVRYTVKPDQAEHNAELVRAVYEELHRTNPSGMRSETIGDYAYTMNGGGADASIFGDERYVLDAYKTVQF